MQFQLEKGSKKFNCPSCGKKTYTRYLDTYSGVYLSDCYGRCDRESKCNYHNYPTIKDFDAKQVQPNCKEVAPVQDFIINHFIGGKIDYSKKYFTEVEVYNNSSSGIKSYFSLVELENRLNTYVKNQSNKNNNPAILKGLYKNGTSGDCCAYSTPFLFFDIDVKENENVELLNEETNNLVFEVLKDLSVLVWRSNSQKGIAGILFVPEFQNLDHVQADKHLKLSKSIYEYVQSLVFKRTNISVSFDYQQGKFRQIRYLAEQKQNRLLSNNPFVFYSNNSQVLFDFDTFLTTLKGERYEHNVFIQNLIKNVLYPFNTVDLNNVISIYRLGTIIKGYRSGAITFPFIDCNQNVRAVQVKQFDNNNHTVGTDFLHSVIEKYYISNSKPLPDWLSLYLNHKKRITCLFGEHLLSKYPNNPIALVEAPKTAIYGTLYFGSPSDNENNMLWLAVYNKSSFSFDKLKVLRGREVYVFPDLSNNKQTYNEWQEKALNYEKQLSNTRFIFSDLLERHTTEEQKQNGLDLADFLIMQDWRKLRNL